MLDGVIFHCRRYYFMAAAARLVWHCHCCNDVESVANQSVKTLYSELRSAEKYYSEIFFIHIIYLLCLWRLLQEPATGCPMPEQGLSRLFAFLKQGGRSLYAVRGVICSRQPRT